MALLSRCLKPGDIRGQHGNQTKLILLSATTLAGIAATPALAQEDVAADTAIGTTGAAADDGKEIIVTASRRAVTLQDTPINITAIGAEQPKTQGIDDVRKLGDFTPGVTAIDTGPRSTGDIVLRGIGSADTSTTSINQNNALAIYLGEVLLCRFQADRYRPGGGAARAAGRALRPGHAVRRDRYVPKRPNTDPGSFGGEVHARGFGKSHSGKAGYNGDVRSTSRSWRDKIAFRAVIGYYYDEQHLGGNRRERWRGAALLHKSVLTPRLVGAEARFRF